jgi:Domain of unknown function (DUF4148)
VQSNPFKSISGVMLVAGALSTSAWAQMASPAMAASAPVTRAEVKADAATAKREGSIPQGEAGVTKDQPKGGSLPTGPNKMKGEKSRDEVKAETKAAMAAGTIPMGEGGVTKATPKGAEKVPKGSQTTRAAVKAEAKRAEKAGEVPQGEASKPPKTL